MSRTRLLSRRAAAVVAAGLVLVSLPLPGAGAQEAATASLDLIAIPPWHAPGDEMGLRIRVTNTGTMPLENYGLVVGLLNRVETRSALETSLDLGLVQAPSSFPVQPVPEDPLPPGGSVTITVDDPVETLVLLGPNAANGVYPLKLTLQDAVGTTLDTVTTQLLFYTEPQEVRLTIVPVVPLHDVPARGPDGVFHPDADGRYPLEEAVAEDGWLTTVVDVLEAEVTPAPSGRRRQLPASLRLGIAPSARLLEELDDMADGYRRAEGGSVVSVPPDSPSASAAAAVLERLAGLLRKEGVQPLLAPYAFADLPSIATTEGAIARQMSEAAVVLHDVLGSEVDPRWVFPPGGRLDSQVLDELPAGAAGLRTFFAPEALEPAINPDLSGCPIEALSLTCPVRVRPETGGSVTGYVFDAKIQDHLVAVARGEEPVVSLQRFFAETAMIREESPGIPRVIQATASTTWRASAPELRRFARTLARAPWLSSATPLEGLAVAEADAERQLLGFAPPLPNRPSDAYFEGVEDASEAVEHFASIEPPAALAQRLRRNVLVALARAWWDEGASEGYAYAREASEEVAEELAKIGAVGASETTLTSRRGALQFVVFNETGYDVRVRVELDARGDLEVSDAVRDLVMTDDQQTISYDVTARASGIFPITVRLETPDGFEIQRPQTITVRSTEFNQIALALTIGALAFLVLFYVGRGVRRRRRTAGAESA